MNRAPVGVSFVETASCTAPVGKATAQPVGQNSKWYVVGPTGDCGGSQGDREVINDAKRNDQAVAVRKS